MGQITTCSKTSHPEHVLEKKQKGKEEAIRKKLRPASTGLVPGYFPYNVDKLNIQELHDLRMYTVCAHIQHPKPVGQEFTVMNLNLLKITSIHY